MCRWTTAQQQVELGRVVDSLLVYLAGPERFICQVKPVQCPMKAKFQIFPEDQDGSQNSLLVGVSC